jgi:hypothetical protein
MLESIKRIASGGHSFEIEIDKDLKTKNEERDIKTSFYIDGDGMDRILDIKVKNVKE